MIFEDPSRQRWRAARVVFVIMSLLGLLLLGDLTWSLLTAPPLPRLARHDHARALRQLIEVEEAERGGSAATAPARMNGATASAVQDVLSRPFLRTAFVVQDDPHSVQDLRRHGADLDIVFPNWYCCPEADGQIVETIRPDVLPALAGSKALVMPLLANTNAQGEWQAEALSDLLHDEEASRDMIHSLVARLQAVRAQGINVDFEQLEQNDRQLFVDWVEDLVKEFHANGLYVTVDLPLNDEAYDYEAIGQLADAVVVMAYDEHYERGRPGAVASQEWFAEGIEAVAQRVGKQKLIVALGAYGYDWNLSKPKEGAESLSFADAMLLAEDQGAEIAIDKTAVNPTFSYKAENGDRHEVWFLDAVTAWNQYALARREAVRGIGLWRLGMEDPGMWEFFVAADKPFDPRRLAVVKSTQYVSVDGEGELLRVTQLPADGRRELSFDGNLIDFATYEALPRYCRVEKLGKPAGKVIALTFDDGPDGIYTPQVLDILKRERVRATFFLVGDQVQRYPECVKRALAEGHMLGNHTFFHPNVQNVSEMRLKLELNSTQRIIETVTGRQTLLFRAPYDTDSLPLTPRELLPLYAVNRLGYVVAAADIDSTDYERPGAETIVARVLHDLELTNGNVIVMHDAGGDRRQTVTALQTLIPLLRQRGYSFVTLNELVGLPESAFMPHISAGERVVIMGSDLLTLARSGGWALLVILFFATTVISVGRILFLGVFVFRSHREQQKRVAGFTPPVLVLVPAYNEAKVIRRTLEGLLQSDYPHLRVLVIDDGSTDETATVVETFARRHPQVSLLKKANGGKAAALNVGLREAQAEYVVTIDADTIVMPDTVRQLVAPFADERVDAVCGNVQVGNVHSLLTAFQDVEYVTSQNYDRRAFDALNCISVVPGATGAWRRSAVLAAGGYAGNTLTEDADLTLTLLEKGKRIVYAPLARSITEAPETARALFKQRFRWSFGTLQCLWKHRKRFFHGSLGWIALPNMLVFQLLFPILSPIGDLVLALSLFRGDLKPIALGYLLFLAMDLTGSLIAFTLDRRSFRHLAVVLVQRFYYRQFMYVVTFKAILAAVRGRRHGWNKLDRRATVAAPEPAMAGS